MTHTFSLKRFLTFFGVLVLAASFLHAEDADARKRRRRQGRKPRYSRPANTEQCAAYSWRPSAKTVPGATQANGRVPYMTGPINTYLRNLQSKGCGLSIQSTFRDCRTNSNVGGAQKSRHLCGAGADTSGCSKKVASSVCRQSGLTYIEEGAGKFAHCQINSFCSSIRRD